MRQSHLIQFSIARPVEEVYAFLADPLNYPRWAAVDGGITQIRQNEWLTRTAFGDRIVRFTEPNPYGILDHAVYAHGEEPVTMPMELYENPQSLFVAGFLGSPKMNFLTGKFADPFKATTVGVRSEHIDIVPSNGTWSGKVIYSENLGSDSYIYVDVGATEPVVVRQPGKANYRSGDMPGSISTSATVGSA